MLSVNDANSVESLTEQFHPGSFLRCFQIADDGMLDDIGEYKANEAVGCVSAGVVKLVGIVEVVAPFGRGSQIQDFLESLAVSWNGGIKPRIGVGFDVDERAKRAVRCTVLLLGAFFRVHDVKREAVSVSMPFGRAGVDMELSVFIVLVMPHASICGAKGCAVGVKLDAALIEEMGKGFLAVF